MQIGKAAAQIEILKNLADYGAQSVLQRIVATIRGWIALHVLGGHGGTHEHEIVVVVRALQDAAAHGVEERLC
jgi:hypothetical protein